MIYSETWLLDTRTLRAIEVNRPYLNSQNQLRPQRIGRVAGGLPFPMRSLGPRCILQDDSIPIDIFERCALQFPIRIV
jgi:hypothetical protein